MQTVEHIYKVMIVGDNAKAMEKHPLQKRSYITFFFDPPL